MLRIASLLAATLALPFASASAQEDFYKGKQINWVLSAGEGGGYSSYARAFAPFFEKAIPGNPNIVIQNMPGAGGIRAMMFLANVAPKDGTTIGMVHSSVPFAPLYGTKGANFDPRQMNWIGSISRATAICVAWHTSGVREWKDLFEKEYIVGGTGAGSQMETLPALLNKLYGTKIKIVSGYKGGNDVYLAMERGEVSGRCGGLVSSIRSTRPDWFPQKKIFVPIAIGLERSPDLPDVPSVVEIVPDAKKKQILQLVLAPQEMDRPILAPPGVPAQRVELLRKAFHNAMNDKGFIAEAEKQHIEIDEVPGEKVAEVVRNAFSLPPEIVAAAKEAMSSAPN
ncbi:MAG: Bug family tripartite tricarboxylate transporter substrate binding protein [Beijerinckiaceae bacterium]